MQQSVLTRAYGNLHKPGTGMWRLKRKIIKIKKWKCVTSVNLLLTMSNIVRPGSTLFTNLLVFLQQNAKLPITIFRNIGPPIVA